MSEQWNENQKNTQNGEEPRVEAYTPRENVSGSTSETSSVYRYSGGEKTYTGEGYSQSRESQNGSSYQGQPYNGQSYQNPYRSGQAYSGGQKPKKPKKRIAWGKIVGISAGIVLICATIGGAAWGISRLTGNGGGTQVAAGTTEEATQGDPVIPTSQVTASSDATASVVDVSDVVEANMSAMVAITTTEVYNSYSNYYDYFVGNGSQQEVTGAGSGIIIGDNGSELWILTNNHVVSGADSVKVTFDDGSTVDAYVKGTNENPDLAMVGVSMDSLSEDTVNSITKVSMGDSDSLRLGEGVIAIGNALGLGQSVSTGVVSALNRDVQTSDGGTMEGLIQTDAAINPGNSGGALLDMEGNLIGINVAKTSDTDVEGMGFAIPISQVTDIIEELTAAEPLQQVSEDQYPYLGVQLKDLDSNFSSMYGMPSGILVYAVEENSPAAAAGMQAQDIITKFDGHSVSNYSELNDRMSYYAGGTTVTITVERVENGKYVEHELTVTLGLRSDYQE